VSTPSQAPGREQKVARVIDRDVAPIWHDRFARLLLRHLPSSRDTFVLDAHCGSGRTTYEILQRLDDSARVLAIEDDANELALARARMRPEWKQRVYFKPGTFDDVTEMEDDTYDVSVANLVLGEIVHDWRTALAELIRVTKPGGRVLVTMPLAGSWAEPEELVEEILRENGRRDLVPILHRVRRIRPRAEVVVDACRGLGVDDESIILEREAYELLFRSGREFLFAPVVEHGPLRLWRTVFAQAGDPQAAFWALKEAIDTYWQDHVFSATIHAGVLAVRVPGGAPGRFASQYWSRYPELDAIFRGTKTASLEADDDDDDMDVDLDIDVDFSGGPSHGRDAEPSDEPLLPVLPLLDDEPALAHEPIDPHGLFGETSPEQSLNAGVIPFDEPDLMTPLPSVVPSASDSGSALRPSATRSASVETASGLGSTAAGDAGVPDPRAPAAPRASPTTDAPAAGPTPATGRPATGGNDALRAKLQRLGAPKKKDEP
jgi:ubiquinone/menaquinone biosynthesis C-methylase UbiE